MGQKTVRFSDLSGQLITHDDALARIVVHEHPELVDGPVEIEALTDEAEAIEQAVSAVWAEGWRTEDVAVPGCRIVGTREMGQRVAEKAGQIIRRLPGEGRLAG